ncbi:MAG TPA: DNA-binding protein WhiA [Candidatus Limnocylindria bacterium]
MLVANELKGELARIQPARACCRRAELAGLLFSRRDAGGVSTLDHATARTAVQLATSLGMPAAGPRSGASARSVASARAASRAKASPPGRHHLQVKLDRDLADAWAWQSAPSCDRRAFLRGTLLGASISVGAGAPHVEFVLGDVRRARELRSYLRDSEVRAGILPRRGRNVVYIKGQEEVATLLRLVGANRALLDFETGRVARDVRNRLNRLLNAEEANLGRTVRAADRQLQAIRHLEATGELERLPTGVREAAAQRRRQPDADLDALASELGVSRSAVNHRLRRLVAIAAASRGDPATS